MSVSGTSYPCVECAKSFNIAKLTSTAGFITCCKKCETIICQSGKCLGDHMEKNLHCIVSSIPPDKLHAFFKTNS